MAIIVIDDERTFKGTGVWYKRTAEQGLAFVAGYWSRYYTLPMGVIKPLEELWLDHDLGDDGGDIFDVVTFMCAVAGAGMAFPVEEIFVHSQNPSGAARIVLSLERHYKVALAALPELDDAPVSG